MALQASRNDPQGGNILARQRWSRGQSRRVARAQRSSDCNMIGGEGFDSPIQAEAPAQCVTG